MGNQNGLKKNADNALKGKGGISKWAHFRHVAGPVADSVLAFKAANQDEENY